MNEEKPQYSAWCLENGAQIPSEKIYEIFFNLGAKFGFQDDNVNNMFDHFMTLLDSRASRMTCPNALLSLHLDYIGGKNSNFRTWFLQYNGILNMTGHRRRERNGELFLTTSFGY